MASILIIDDDVTLLARLGDQLEDVGHQVEKVSDLTHAQRVFAERRPDMVILEVRTDSGGGWELLPRLAAESAVIVLSGAGREEDVVRGFSAGAIDYVSKPYRSAEVLARVRIRLAGLAALAPAAVTDPPFAPPAGAPVTPPPPPRRRRDNRRGEPADETVFMSEAEEMALLRMAPAGTASASPAPETAEPGEPGALGRQLRSERLRRHLTLVQVENEVKIRMSYLQAMEDEKFTLLPRGPVAIQMVRDYAAFLGLDAGGLAEQFRTDHYVDPVEPPPALGGSASGRGLPRWLILLLAALLALSLAAGAIYALDPGFFVNLPATLQLLWQQLLGLFG